LIEPQIPCPRCGSFTSVEKVFCVRCGSRVIPLTEYDLTASDFIYPPDESALESFREFKPLSPLINELILKRYVRALFSRLEGGLAEISLSSEVGSIIRECGIILGLRSLPRSYLLKSDKPLAFTFGTGKSDYLFLSSGLLDLLDDRELRAAIGHELGHVKCGHSIYHTIAGVLTSGIELSLGLMGGVLSSISSPMLRLMLLSWHRDSEISADRAGLIVANDPGKVISLLRKLHREPPEPGELLGEILSTHPTYEDRVKRLSEYYRSADYHAVKRKVERRLRLSKALSPVCRFCGGSKPLTSIFCPSCGRSQL